MENNQAAWILAADNSPSKSARGRIRIAPLQTKLSSRLLLWQSTHPNGSAPYFSILQMKEFGYLPLKYPHVLGSDVAGTVVKVGEEVKRFKAGDRVIGHCLGLLYGGAKHGGFQNFTTLREVVTAPVPDSVRFEDAVVLPLAISTASVGLFDDLKLRLPSADPAVLIWGAASSMGSIAVQLSVAAGYRVITTASTKNHDYVRALTSPHDEQQHVTVFDYHRPNTTNDIIDHIKSSSSLKFAGAYDCVVHAFGGGVMPSVLWPPADLPADVRAGTVNAIWPGTLAVCPSSRVWRDYVPKALANGALRMQPGPEVVGTGLDKIEGALNWHKAGDHINSGPIWKGRNREGTFDQEFGVTVHNPMATWSPCRSIRRQVCKRMILDFQAQLRSHDDAKDPYLE
ncbi:hypothetical protein PG994_008328 [Apiospora phragmitis]|uniref:Enoyl reductase (ER) domain-containing protein n=1 Tax=Apiospora phragmitis TaxID=2905665 RepID=A0ABR1USU2_9PEZI